MRARAIIMLGLALALGAISVFLARNWLKSQVQPVVVQQPSVPLTTVVVARTKLVSGNRLGREHVKEIKWPVDSVPVGAFKTVAELIGGKEPRYVMRTIHKGEPIMPMRVTGFGEKATMSATLSRDMRAVTIPINAVAGVAGFVLPGDKVDILLTRSSKATSSPITDIFMQNVKILGIDQRTNDEEGKPIVARAATLEVTPVQAQKLVLAQRVGSLSLTLRSVTNAKAVAQQTVTVSDLNIGEYNSPPKPKLVKVDPLPAVPEPSIVSPIVPEPAVTEPSVTKIVRQRPKKRRGRFAAVNVIRGVAASVEKVPMEGKMRK